MLQEVTHQACYVCVILIPRHSLCGEHAQMCSTLALRSLEEPGRPDITISGTALDLVGTARKLGVSDGLFEVRSVILQL
jgi:hypothetical protein